MEIRGKTLYDFGYANDWSGTPKIITEAMDAGFMPKETYHSKRGFTSYKIDTPTAVIKWKVDSSD